MTDFHMHVLPGMDDGSKSVGISTGMLERSAAAGIDTVAATSHFYGEENSPREFLKRREQAYEELCEATEGRDDLPRLLLGAEVCFFTGISAVDDLDSLCLEGTNLLLLEMPFIPWTERMFREVDVIRRGGIQPVAAHIERYLPYQTKSAIEEFCGLGILCQCNASFFLNRKTAHRALRRFQEGRIRFLGSDAHNLDIRPPNLGEAVKVLERKFGRGAMGRYASEVDSLISGDAR